VNLDTNGASVLEYAVERWGPDDQVRAIARMHFNVSQLLREHSGSSRTYELDDEFRVGSDSSGHRLRGTVELVRTDAGVWVSAALDSEVPSTCSRCAEEFTQPVHMVFDDESFSAEDHDDMAGAEDDQDRLLINEKHILDLTDAVSQYSTLSMPMKPMCRVDCKGLCPTCSANLNTAPCQCDQTARDSRWGPLLDLVPSSGAAENGTS
jgi:uncharacterized protein